MKFVKDINVQKDLKFKKIRSTPTSAKIIDIEMDIFQTGWCKICYDVDYAICTDVPDQLKNILMEMDNRIIEHCSEVLDFCPQEITTMFRPILRPRGEGYYFRVPISSSSVLFGISEENGEKIRKHYNKKEMPDVLRVGNYVRFIIRMKKLYFKDHSLTVQMEMKQAEYA